MEFPTCYITIINFRWISNMVLKASYFATTHSIWLIFPGHSTHPFVNFVAGSSSKCSWKLQLHGELFTFCVGRHLLIQFNSFIRSSLLILIYLWIRVKYLVKMDSFHLHIHTFLNNCSRLTFSTYNCSDLFKWLN